MKFFIAAFVFFLALGFNVQSLASAPTETCTAEKTDNCTPAGEAAAHGETKSHGGGHNDLGARMNSLFPEKQKNPAVVVRPKTVKLISPKFMSAVSGPQKLEWSPADGATSYHVQVATDPNFKWLVAEQNLLAATSFDVANVEAGQKYYWRVAAVKRENNSEYTKSLFVSSVFSVK